LWSCYQLDLHTYLEGFAFHVELILATMWWI